MFVVMFKRLMAILQSLLAIRRGFVFGNNNVPADNADDEA